MVFDIPVWMTIIAIILSAVLSIVAVRSVGETDINPVGGMGKVTQLAYGGLAPGQMSTNLMAAAITGAGASQAGDMMQDLKTGHLLGASPRKRLSHSFSVSVLASSSSFRSTIFSPRAMSLAVTSYPHRPRWRGKLWQSYWQKVLMHCRHKRAWPS